MTRVPPRRGAFVNPTRREVLFAVGAALGEAPVFSQSRTGRPAAVRRSGNRIELENDRLKAVFTRTQERIEQEYFARGDSGWVRLVTALNTPARRPAGTAPLYSDSGVAVKYRLLVADSLRLARSTGKQGGIAGVTLSGKVGLNTIEQTVSLGSGSDHFHIEVTASLGETPPRVEYLLSSFVFQGEHPDYTHAPSIKREPANVIGDRVFHCPVVALQKAELFAALAPDLDILKSDVVYARDARPVEGLQPARIEQDPATITLPNILDLDLQSGLTQLPIFSYGFADYLVQPHVYWLHENKNGAFVRTLGANRLHYGFDLFVSATAPQYSGYQVASRHMWSRYGSHYAHEPKPQVMPFAEYVAVCYPAAFKYDGDSAQDTHRYLERKPYAAADSGPLPTWLDFEIDGQAVGGIRGTPTQWYNDIQFMGWWNNVHLAQGMNWWGRKTGDASLTEKARRIINLALAAPRNEGIFPAVYNYKNRQWVGCYWKPAGEYNPTILPKYWDFSSDYYQTCSASKTAALLMRYGRAYEPDPRILPYLKPYGDFLAARMDGNGCVPAWFTRDLNPVPYLRFNAEGGVHMSFLAELYRATGEERYHRAALQISEFLIREILPQQRWYDFETFYSCSSKPEATYDVRTGQWPRCTLSMIWAVDGFSAWYELTRDKRIKDAAERAVDYLALYQSVWQPPFMITAYAFGGFVSQNSDAEWLDMRQCVASEAMVRAGMAMGRQDILERGVAALRSAYALVNHSRVIENGVFPTPDYPPGITPENIDHGGLPQLPLRSGSDWGEGGALASAAEILRTAGGLYIDFSKNIAVGVDGVTIKNFRRDRQTIYLEIENQLSRLRVPWEKPFGIDAMIVGVPPDDYRILVNREPPVTASLNGRTPTPLTIAART